MYDESEASPPVDSARLITHPSAGVFSPRPAHDQHRRPALDHRRAGRFRHRGRGPRRPRHPLRVVRCAPGPHRRDHRTVVSAERDRGARLAPALGDVYLATATTPASTRQSPAASSPRARSSTGRHSYGPSNRSSRSPTSAATTVWPTAAIPTTRFGQLWFTPDALAPGLSAADRRRRGRRPHRLTTVRASPTGKRSSVCGYHQNLAMPSPGPSPPYPEFHELDEYRAFDATGIGKTRRREGSDAG